MLSAPAISDGVTLSGSQSCSMPKWAPAILPCDHLVQPAPDVRVDRAGERELLGHLGVRQRGEDHRDQADDVDQRDHALTGVVDRAEDRPRCDRHHEDQPVDDQVDR
jgi:hypothetical protein